jgi:hypothetical protein
VVGIVTSLPAGRLTGSNTGTDVRVYLSTSEHPARWCAPPPPPNLIFAVFRGYFCWVKRPGCEIPHLNVVSRLRITGAVPLIVPYAFME